MKGSVFFACAALVLQINIARAGSAAEDPVVSHLRNEFAAAHQPTVAELTEGKTWTCSSFSSMRGNFEKSEMQGYYTFARFNGLVRNTQPGALVQYYAPAAGSYSGTYSTNPSYREFVRVTANDDLVSEWTLPKKDARVDGEASVSDPAFVAVSYTICPKDQMGAPLPTPPAPIRESGLSPMSTNYDSLVRHYETAVLPDATALNGWYSGRCFKKSEPMKAEASLFVAVSDVKSSSLVQFPGRGLPAVRYVMIQYGYGSSPENTFDAPQGAKEVEDTLRVIREDTYSKGTITIDRGALLSPRGSGDIRVRQISGASPYVLVDFANGYAFCYYFKKVN